MSSAAGHYVEPRTKLETFLCRQLEKALARPRIGVLDEFRELGLDSFTAVVFVTQIQKVVGHAIYLPAVFEEPTIERFGRFLLQEYPGIESRLGD